jgi:hypothetical protein
LWLMIYEIKKSILLIQFRFHSSLVPFLFLFSLRARVLWFAINSKSKSYKNNSFLRDTKASHRDYNFSFPLLYPCLLVFSLLLPFQHAHTAPQISIVWGTTTNASSSDVLKGFDGLPLSAGVQGNGDGDLVELGYFSEASTESPFSGTWIPLTQQTKVGDSSSGYGFGNGMFIFTSNFYLNSDQVVVFPTEPKEYSEDLGFTVTSSTPPTGTPFCIRFYDGPQKGEARYNTVTGNDWLWPAFPNGSSIPINLYIKIASGFAPAGSSWKYGSTFEDNDPADRFKTTITPQYSIGVAISEYSNGSGTVVDINGSYEWGEVVNLTAAPQTHSGFMGWIGKGIQEPWNQNTTLTVSEDQTVYAEFFAVPYLLNLDSQGEGSVSGSGIFSFGDSVTINALPSYGHSFVRWEKNGVLISTSPETTISIEGDTDLTAIFSRNQYQVNIGSTIGGTYEILDDTGSIASTYSHGFTYTIRALPDNHYGFNGWDSTTSGLSMLDNASFAQTTFIPTADANFTAIFSELSYKLNIASTQGHSSLTDSGYFPALSTVPIQVEAAEGFAFDYWIDPMGIIADSNSHLTEVNMSLIYPYTEASISAVLRLDDYDESDINITSGYGGNTFIETDSSGGFTHFNSYELNATSIPGYEFDQWIGDIQQLQYGPYEPINHVLIEGSLSLRASYKLIYFKINFEIEGNGAPYGPETFTIADTPTIEAISFPGSRFTHWSGDTDFLLNQTASETLIQVGSDAVLKDLNFTAHFEPESYEIEFRSYGNGAADIYLSNEVEYSDTNAERFTVDSETQITFEAIADNGWTFSNWSGLPDISDLFDPNAFLDPSSTIIYFKPTKDLNITSNFAVSEYDDQQIVINTGVGGDLFYESEENGNFIHFVTYDLNASPQKGYQFSEWIIDPAKANILSYGIDQPNNEITINGEVEINATFSLVQFNLNISSNEGGGVTGDSNYTVISTPVIQATPLVGWEFSHWSGDIEYLLDPDAKHTQVNHSSFNLKDLSFTANFIREIHEVSLNLDGEGSFDIFQNNNLTESDASPQVLYIDSGTRIRIDANPSGGWKFDNWLGLPNPDDLTDSSPSLNPESFSINFIPSSDVNLTSQLIRESYNLQILPPDFGGSVTGGGIYPFETLVDVNASANVHFIFKEWTGDLDALVSATTLSNNKISIPDSNISIKPIFEPKVYAINQNLNDDGYFEVSGTYNDNTYTNLNEYNATSSISITAIPNDSETYMLNHIYWENSLEDSGYQYSSTITIPFLDGNYSFWASFVPRNEIGYSLLSDPPYGGTAGTNNDLSSAQTQRLIANANSGFSFVGWSNQSAVSFSPNWSLHSVDTSLSENDEVWANFQTKTQFLSLSCDLDKGTVSGFSDEISHGDYLTITASPKENYAFSGWEIVKEIDFNVSKNQSTIDAQFSRIFLNNKESPELNLIRGYTYHFRCDLNESDQFFISTSPITDEIESFYLSGVTGHLSSNGILTFEVPNDAPSTLYYHSTGQNFAGNVIHISDVSDETILPNPKDPALNQRITHHFGLIATFERTRHSLTTNTIGEGDVSYTSKDFYFWGDDINITAIPDEHWHFSRWEGNGDFDNSTSPNINFIISEDTQIQAIFDKNQYAVNASATPESYGIVENPSQTFSFGEYVALLATPLIGKQFDQWNYSGNLSLDNPEDQFNPSASFKVLGNADVNGSFSKVPINILVEYVSIDQNNELIPGDIGGTVNVPSSIYYGDIVELELNSSTGYTLLYWEDNNTGEQISSAESISFTAFTDRNLKVVLRKLYYQLDINQSTGGSASILTDPPFYWRDPVNITAVPDEHWEFVQWVGIGSNNLESSTVAQAVLRIERDSNLTAEFKRKEYSLEVSANPQGYGQDQIIPALNFEDNVTIEANAMVGKEFERWEIEYNATLAFGSSLTEESATFFINGDSKIKAHYKSKVYQVNSRVVVVDENDTVLEDKFGGIIVGPQEAEHNSTALFAITLSNGYRLKKWAAEDIRGDYNSTSADWNHTMNNSDLNVTAYVTPRKYEINVLVTPAGSADISLNGQDFNNNYSQDDYSYGDEIILTSTPSSGYEFVNWSTTGTIFSQPGQQNQTFEITNDVYITANFAPTGGVNLTLLSEPSGAASSLLGGNKGPYFYDPAHSIKATNKWGYIFKYWEYNNSPAVGIVRDAYSSTTSLRLDRDLVLTAVFEEDNSTQSDSGEKFLLNVYSSNPAYGTTTGSGFFVKDNNTTIKAEAKNGYKFSHWEGEFISDSSASTTDVKVTKKMTVVAHFQSIDLPTEPPIDPDISPQKFPLTVSSNDSTMGEVSGSGVFRGIRMIKALPGSGYEFSHWESEGNYISDPYASITEVDVQSNITVTAYFQRIGLFDDTEFIESNWWRNPWFGYFWKDFREDWIFHEKLGWVFLNKEDDSSIWIWTKKLNGWFWTAKEHYPYLHSASTQTWYWINLDKSDFTELVIYDYANAKWLSLQ